jgi:hypothetical protein
MRSSRSVAFAIALLMSVTLAAADPLTAVVGSYLELQAALAADNFDGVKGPAAHIADQAKDMASGGKEIAAKATAVQQAANINAARDAFADLSAVVIAAAKADGWKGLDDVKVAYCPMNRKSWLQKDESVRNPYYGSSMLDCGLFQKK